MILLCTLNARYIHSSLGLRYLYAQLQEMQAHSRIIEFTINQRAQDIAEQLLELQPEIIGFGLYIWNITQTTEVIAILKALRPDIRIILGGPEISHETEDSPAFPLADFIIRGQADFAFAELCRALLDKHPPPTRIINAASFDPAQLSLPYAYYSDEDIRQRVIYVEASRGCPYKCEFCLSALDKTSRPVDMDALLQQLQSLYDRGARHFKFVDRTFNLSLNNSERILSFFLGKPLEDLFLHFELIPDRLPHRLRELIRRFPAGSLQFEIGIQSFNPQVQQLISRQQDQHKTIENLQFLRTETAVHMHTDLIAGLPGEDLDSFARGFDLLVSLNPQEIQLGILKRLRGTPIIRHQQSFAMVFNPNPPYNILSTREMDSATLFRVHRFARYWDMIANSGRFVASLPDILGDQPFARFMALSDWLHATTGQTHRIALQRLFGLLYQYFQQQPQLISKLQQDYASAGFKQPLQHRLPGATSKLKDPAEAASSRQQRHLAS